LAIGCPTVGPGGRAPSVGQSRTGVCPSTGNQLSFSSIICHACLLPGYVLVTLNGCYCRHCRRQTEVGQTQVELQLEITADKRKEGEK